MSKLYRVTGYDVDDMDAEGWLPSCVHITDSIEKALGLFEARAGMYDHLELCEYENLCEEYSDEDAPF